jgi:hypothetical protein
MTTQIEKAEQNRNSMSRRFGGAQSHAASLRILRQTSWLRSRRLSLSHCIPEQPQRLGTANYCAQVRPFCRAIPRHR